LTSRIILTEDNAVCFLFGNYQTEIMFGILSIPFGIIRSAFIVIN